MRGWHNEPMRHSLARRGIRTRAIPNPLADPDHYDPDLYEKNWLKDKAKRPYRGSGLENINEWDVLHPVEEFIYEFDGSKEWEEGRLDDYYYMFKDRFNDFDMSYDDFEELYESGKKLFNVKAIYIFGSRVTGYWIPYSDIDIYIELERTPGIENEYIEYMADKMSDTIDNYLAEEGRVPMVRDDKGTPLKVDIPIISTQSPWDNFDDDNYPALLIWEAEN